MTVSDPLLVAEVGRTRLDIVVGDITKLAHDAIVNAANSSLLGGGGVDGAIHRAAGPELLAECRTLGGCPTGSARITRGYRLPARHVIHAVGPVWHGGGSGEEDLLASCYRVSLALASEHRLASLAYPAISTGVYRFPADRAARIAVGAVVAEISADPRGISRVTFCEGFRMPAAHGSVPRAEAAGVRKPPREETAERLGAGSASAAMGIWARAASGGSVYRLECAGD